MKYFENCMTKEALEQEHRRLVKQLHPDLHPENPNATAEFQEMQEQYEERKAELNGDYSKSRKGRERREREERERRERERREAARRKVEQAVSQARLNRQKPHTAWCKGDYVYARGMNDFSAGEDSANDVLRMAVNQGVRDETVVLIEAVFDIPDKDFMAACLSHATDGEIYGGWEILQKADPANGIPKAKRVAKVVMFRSEHYCIFGNPKGDQVIEDYYLPANYETMFSDHLHCIKASIEREQQEAARIEAERRAKIEAEQRPLIEEWKDKLIAISAGLTSSERQTVAGENLKRMLKAKFPGVRFSVKTNRYGETSVTWEDGPKTGEVIDVADLFNGWLSEPTPWSEQFGTLSINYCCFNRKMSVLTKARILQDLGQVTEAFREGAIDDEVEVSAWDWQMLHVLCGVDISNPDAPLCMCTLHADGRRTVYIHSAVRYVFEQTSYVKPKNVKRQKTAA